MNKRETAQTYCKTHGLKFRKFTPTGFIASATIPVMAGMEYMPGESRYRSIPIRQIGKKTVTRQFICYPDGDVTDNGIIQPEEK